MNDFWKENDLDGSKGDLKALGHPQRPRQAQPGGVLQVPFMFMKKWHGACLYTIFQRQIDFKKSQRDTGWSWCSLTPSATSTSSTKASTASTSYVHQNLKRYLFIYYFLKNKRFKTVPAWWSRCSRTPSATSSSSTMRNDKNQWYIWWLCECVQIEQ